MPGRWPPVQAGVRVREEQPGPTGTRRRGVRTGRPVPSQVQK